MQHNLTALKLADIILVALSNDGRDNQAVADEIVDVATRVLNAFEVPTKIGVEALRIVTTRRLGDRA